MLIGFIQAASLFVIHFAAVLDGNAVTTLAKAGSALREDAVADKDGDAVIGLSLEDSTPKLAKLTADKVSKHFVGERVIVEVAVSNRTDKAFVLEPIRILN